MLRVAIVKQKIPLQYAAFALIVIGQRPMRQFLLQWNPNWSAFNLIGGKSDTDKEGKDSLVHTIRRELEEEMGLSASTEFQITQELASVQMIQYSNREQRMKEYIFAIFEVDIFPTMPTKHGVNPAIRWLSTGHENVFVSPSEIENLRTKDGRPISVTTKAILHNLGELPTPPHPMMIS